MSVPIAYIAVVLIWSTTPLGIVWSSESVSPTLAVLMRMIIATFLSLLIVKMTNIKFPWHRQAVRVYCFSGIGIFGGMLLSYMAAPYIPSGMMSLIFGFAPVLSGLLAQKILNEPKFSRVRLAALIVSFCGLAIICSDGLSLNEQSWIGLLLVITAVTFFSLSGVLVKSVHIDINPIATTAGALSVSTPLFFITWILDLIFLDCIF